MRPIANWIRFVLLLATMVLAAAPAVALSQEGGSLLPTESAVRVFDASDPSRPWLAAETETLVQSGSYVFSHDSLFVATGDQLRRYARGRLSEAATAAWSAAGPILGITDGEERGLVLVLEPGLLSLVRFSVSGAPQTVWSFAVEAAPSTGDAGRLLVRSGSLLYLADRSIPGIRVLLLDPSAPPVTAATYVIDGGAVHDLALWGRTLAALTDAGLVIAETGPGGDPPLRTLGNYTTSTRPASVDINSRFAILADGASVTVLDIDPASSGFLAGPLDGWAGGSDIRVVRLDKGERAYVLLDASYEILNVAPFGGR